MKAEATFAEGHLLLVAVGHDDIMAEMLFVSCMALQEVASNHAVGMWGRNDEGFASLPSDDAGTVFLFVMTRLQIRMHSYPRWCVPWSKQMSNCGGLQRHSSFECAATTGRLGVATRTHICLRVLACVQG